MLESVRNIVGAIREKTDFVPDVAVILGSGLGDFAESIDQEVVIPFFTLPNFPLTTVDFHKGNFVCGRIGQTKVICMQGRIHLYEGYSPETVVLPVRVMQALGARTLIVTNASGGINPAYRPGQLSIITDHISNFVPNPLIGLKDREMGPHFPDMTAAYDPALIRLIEKVAVDQHIDVTRGVYLQVQGPSFETPAEIRMFGYLGADMVGMSSVVEVIAARHMGMRVAGISLISNLAAGISKFPLSEEEVIEAGNAAGPQFASLLTEVLKRI